MALALLSEYFTELGYPPKQYQDGEKLGETIDIINQQFKQRH
jgi:hypothetical protein